MFIAALELTVMRHTNVRKYAGASSNWALGVFDQWLPLALGQQSQLGNSSTAACNSLCWSLVGLIMSTSDSNRIFDGYSGPGVINVATSDWQFYY